MRRLGLALFTVRKTNDHQCKLLTLHEYRLYSVGIKCWHSSRLVWHACFLFRLAINRSDEMIDAILPHISLSFFTFPFGSFLLYNSTVISCDWLVCCVIHGCFFSELATICVTSDMCGRIDNRIEINTFELRCALHSLNSLAFGNSKYWFCIRLQVWQAWQWTHFTAKNFISQSIY